MQAGKHPGLVPIIAQNCDGNPPWVMYEYVAGGDLADRIRTWAALPPAERFGHVVSALRELAEAIGRLHRLAEPVVHRDLKPSNVLSDTATGRLRVTDFGIGGVAAGAALKIEARGQSTRGGRLLSYLRGSHTPLYSSPQQRDGSDPDPRDDVHALGVIGYQMLTGHLAQGCGTDFEDDLREVGANDELIRVLKRCTSQKPDRRPKDAAELAAALASFGLPLTKEAGLTATEADIIAADFAEWSAVFNKIGTDTFMKGFAPSRVDRWRKSAQLGDVRSQIMLGDSYECGTGNQQDFAQALMWYRKAADQGHAAAQYSIGGLYDDGPGLPRDYNQALAWYRKAAEQGLARAQCGLGLLYQNGQGVPQDYGQALAWCRKAADQGLAVAQCNIGMLYHYGQGVAQDYAQAMAWYRRAADQGNATAQNNIGMLYHDGRGVRKDHAKAIEWLSKAAGRGNDTAKENLKVLEASQRRSSWWPWG